MSAFYGNFFVRSTDLLSLPNVPRDQSYSIEVSHEDDLTSPMVCFQTALLHTASSGERRIRVLTLSLPVTTTLSELFVSADQVAITTLLACKAVERGMSSKLDDARDALTNKCVDILGVYKTHMTASSSGATPNLQICDNLKLMPLLTLGMLKHVRTTELFFKWLVPVKMEKQKPNIDLCVSTLICAHAADMLLGIFRWPCEEDLKFRRISGHMLCTCSQHCRHNV